MMTIAITSTPISMLVLLLLLLLLFVVRGCAAADGHARVMWMSYRQCYAVRLAMLNLCVVLFTVICYTTVPCCAAVL